MKATLLALLTLGSLAFGGVSESITLSTNYSIGVSDAGDGFSGIAFQLTPGTDRYVNSNFITDDATYELTSIAIQWRNTNGATKVKDGVHLVVTDASNLKVIGISNNVDAIDTKDIGGVSKVNVVTNTFEKPVPLSLETPYYAFYVAHANIEDVEVGETLTASVGSVNLMSWGKNGSYTGAYNDFSLTKNLSPFATTVEPVASLAVVKNTNVPEPTTGTLSLLALAGLCIRRRK